MPTQKIPRVWVLRDGVWVGWTPPPSGAPDSVVRIRGVSADDGGQVVIPPDPSFTLGVTRPDTAGVVPHYNDGQLPVYAGPGLSGTTGTTGRVLTITSGMQIADVEIRAFVKWAAGATGWSLKRCRIVGDSTLKYVNVALVDTTNSGAGLIDFCEVTPYANNQDNSRYWLNGFKIGNSVTVQRCNVHDVNDCFTINGSNWSLLGNWAHDMSWRSDDDDHKADTNWIPWTTHNDCIQFGATATSNGRVIGNLLDGNFSQVSGMVGRPTQPGISNTGAVDPALNHGSIPLGMDWWPNAHGTLYQAKSGLLTNTLFQDNWYRYATYLFQANVQGGPTSGNSAVFSGNRLYVGQTPLNSAQGTPGPGTQITTTRSMDTDNYNDLFASTIYATDDLGVSAGWRGHVVQSSPTSGNSKYNSALTPP